MVQETEFPQEPGIRDGNQQRPPSPPKENRRVLMALAVVIVLAAALLVVYFATIQKETENGDCHRTDPSVILRSRTSADVDFWGFSLPQDTSPMELKVILGNDSHTGTYVFPSNNNGAILTLESGDSMAKITYYDPGENEKVNLYDWLRVDGLRPGSVYVIQLAWASDGEVVGEVCLIMPE